MEMDKNSMWALPSGAFVEQILYNRFRGASQGSLAHSFIIDIHDHTIQDLFDPGDWEAILEKVPAWPENDTLLAQSMKGFWKVSLCVLSFVDLS